MTSARATPVTLAAAAQALAQGRTTSRELVEACLERALDPAGEGARAFIRVDAEAARAAADASDRLRAAGAHPGPLAGIPVAVKDLFDVAGQLTQAGSKVLSEQPPARRDADAVARLRAAGLILVGRNNMTEFAYSGLGMNHHYGTPASPWRREERRIPGGSSSGAGVAVADGMALMGLGTDTGGSCRIPAALCGVVGFKPTASRVSTRGAVPLSTSLDSIGPLANSVACCAAIDAVIANQPRPQVPAVSMDGLRLGLAGPYTTDGADATVSAAYQRALGALSAAGARIFEPDLSDLAEIPRINAKGGLVGAEAYAWHRRFLEDRKDFYDPWVLQRFDAGRSQSAADYIDVLEARARVQRAVHAKMQAFDAMLAPTVPVVAPRMDELADVALSNRVNLLLLRNPAMVNFLDGCAISIPMHRAGEAAAGLMVFGTPGSDARVLAIAEAIESALASARG